MDLTRARGSLTTLIPTSPATPASETTRRPAVIRNERDRPMIYSVNGPLSITRNHDVSRDARRAVAFGVSVRMTHTGG